MNDSLINLIFSFNDLETKYQYKFLNRKWKKFIESSNIDGFSHLFKDVINLSSKKINNIQMKCVFTRPNDIISVGNNLELCFLQTFPRVTFIKTHNSKIIPRNADLLHGFVMPNNGISKIILCISGSDYKIYDYKTNISRLIQYGYNGGVNFYRKTEFKTEWIDPFIQPVNLTASFYHFLELDVYDKDGEKYKSIDLIYSYVDNHERRMLSSLPIGKFYNIEYGNKCYLEGDVILREMLFLP